MAVFNRRRLKGNAAAFPRPPRLKTARAAAAPGEKLSLRRRGIFLLPNAFTSGGLFCGFYAIVQAMNRQFDIAAIAIFVAMVLDSLDGRVARMTNTQSDFGAEYDSLADMVAFGAAPGLVIYEWSLRGLGKWGWIAAFVYVAGAALRLARFNTNIDVVDKRFFQGLPSPAAAAMVAGFVWLMVDLNFSGEYLAWFSWIVTVYAGLSMVSNSLFYSFKDINLRKSVPFIFVVLIILGFVAISSNPPEWLFGIFIVYGLSGHVLWLWKRFSKRPILGRASSPDANGVRD